MQKLTDRELLEQIYILLLQINQKLDDTNKEFSMNLAADLLGSMLYDNKLCK